MLARNLMTIFILSLIFLTVVLAVAFKIIGFGGGPLKTASVTVGAKTFQVMVASTTLARSNGLSGKDGLAENEGMYFLFGSFGNYGFWMKDMKFAIDIIWIAGDTVVGFAENAKPEPGKALWSLKIYYPPQNIDKVLEINAGAVQKYGIKIGDIVSFSSQ